MTRETIPVVAPCNICGGTEFGFGPASRLSATKRPPLCVQCRSLERHRVVRAAFDAFPDELLRGTRCLQFSPDPALDPARFGEILVSIWGGENSLDMQAIALPDASFQWIYSSHVINHVPDAAAALRDMLRVVGQGCIVLNVGGSVFNYATLPSDKVFGADRQFKLYGTLYADDIQAVLPQVAVLELVAVDPCSVSIDSIYFASLDEQKLTAMAEAATAHNVHARVFPAQRLASTSTSTSRMPSLDPWDALQREIEEWKASGAAAAFWVRDDDATTPEPRLVELIELCEREAVPLALAIIPLPVTLELIELVSRHQHLVPIQHGFDHLNREPSADKVKSEFPAERGMVEVLRSIQLGRYILTDAFGERALPVFCPPWGMMAECFRERLPALGFTGYSGSRVASEIHRQGSAPAGLRLASAHAAVNRARPSGGRGLAEQQILETLTAVVQTIRLDRSNEPVGIMTHHWGVDESVRHFLKRLFDTTRAAGATWVSAKELFAPRPLSSVHTPAVGNELASAGASTASS
jgi:hypothetical protein